MIEKEILIGRFFMSFRVTVEFWGNWTTNWNNYFSLSFGCVSSRTRTRSAEGMSARRVNSEHLSPGEAGRMLSHTSVPHQPDHRRHALPRAFLDCGQDTDAFVEGKLRVAGQAARQALCSRETKLGVNVASCLYWDMYNRWITQKILALRKVSKGSKKKIIWKG